MAREQKVVEKQGVKCYNGKKRNIVPLSKWISELPATKNFFKRIGIGHTKLNN